MSERLYDVIVVGAGPAGSSIAYELASLGHAVAVFEEKSAPGLNACCTGIISRECFESLDPGEDVILTQAQSARLFSPSGRCLRLQNEKVQAYVVDRSLLDRSLASKARSRGARYFFSAPVVDVITGEDDVKAEVLRCGVRETFRARTLVLANGFKSGLSRKLGLGRARSLLVGAQTEVEANDIHEIEVHLGGEVLRGSFAWLVPTSDSRAYVGLLATAQAKVQLRRFLSSLFRKGRIACLDAEIRQKVIPAGGTARTYGERVVVVGDAAGQVKPTTGGGIYFGHLGARIAAGVLDEALRSDDLSAARLSDYQKLWRARMGSELARGYLARRFWARLGDRQIERVFDLLDGGGLWDDLVKADGFSFDWHSRALLSVLKRGSAYPFLRIKHLLSGEVGP